MLLILSTLFAMADATAATNSHPYDPDMNLAPLVAQAESTTTAAEVRKVDRDAKKITLKHAEIRDLGMPPMTMVFAVKDPSMLDQVKPGDKIRFKAREVNGVLVIDKIERAE